MNIFSKKIENHRHTLALFLFLTKCGRGNCVVVRLSEALWSKRTLQEKDYRNLKLTQ